MTGPLRGPHMRGGVIADAITRMAEHGSSGPDGETRAGPFRMRTSFELTITDNIRSVLDSITMTERQHKLAIAIAATRTIADVRRAVRREMETVFDRPSRYTLNAFWIDPATPDNPTATLEQRAFGGGRVREWLHPQSQGGPRGSKAFENALAGAMGLPQGTKFVPGPGARLDRYGNLSGGQLAQILADLKAYRDSARNMTAASRKRTRRARHFVMRDADGRPLFIALRAAGKLTAVLAVITGGITYTRRFAFEVVARGTATRAFPARYRQAAAQVTRPRGGSGGGISRSPAQWSPQQWSGWRRPRAPMVRPRAG